MGNFDLLDAINEIAALSDEVLARALKDQEGGKRDAARARVRLLTARLNAACEAAEAKLKS